MKEEMKFDYYYGIESEQFSFYRVPRLLIKEKRFKGLSSDAKLLYGLMLDRLSLSRKNGWLDQEERAYIYYTVDTIMEDLGCAKATCSKILAELDSKKGIGLIERIRQGLGKPDRIYVKNFATLDTTNPMEEVDVEKSSKEKGELVQPETSVIKNEERNQPEFLGIKNPSEILEEEHLIESSEIEMKQEWSLSGKEDQSENLECVRSAQSGNSKTESSIQPECSERNVPTEASEPKNPSEFHKKENERNAFWEIDQTEQELEKREENLIQVDVFQEVQKLNFKRNRNQQIAYPKVPLLEAQKLDFQSLKNQASRGTEIELLEVQNLGTSYNKEKETSFSQNNLIDPIHPISSSRQELAKAERKETEEKKRMDGMDQMEEANAYRELIQENIDYQHYMELEDWKERPLYEELYEVICEVVCMKHKTVRIGGEAYPHEWVKAKFLKLNSQHLQYVMNRMQHTTSKILNIKAYLLTALYNAPNTMNYFYQQEVNYDMLGGGWREKGIV